MMSENKNNLKSIFLYLITFLFITIIFLNQIHQNLSLNYFEKVENENYYIKKDNNYAKKKFSEDLIADDSYPALKRECVLTGDFSDRHKVRWVKALFLKNTFLISQKINSSFPYYTNIFLHSFLIFLTLILLNKTFLLDRKYNLLFLLYIAFVFQGQLSEYTYSIFEMFFLSLALYASKHKKFILFLLSGIFASLNRESGFIILLSWLLFNNDYKKLIISYLIAGATFVLLNLDIAKCLINPEFFIPIENQKGQVNFSDLSGINFISLFKLIFLNFLLPFGLAFYYISQTQNKNKILIIMFFIYLLAFLVATPLHHVSIRLIILPLIFASIFYFENQYQKA